MAEKVGNLAIIISGDSRQLMEAMSGAEAAIARFQARQEAAVKQQAAGYGMGATAMSLLTRGATALAGLHLSREFLQVGESALEMSRNYELAEAQLKTLTGSASQAKKVMEELRTFAPSTPYDVTDLSQVMRKLMGSGIAQEQSMTITRRLATVGAGTGGDVASLGRAYAQVSAAGRFMTEELNQFSDADFPIKEFANTARMSMGEFRDKMKDGLIPVSVMEDTFKRLTEAGGKFGTALEDMANTAIGRKKAEDAAHQAYMAERGKRLEEIGMSGRQVGNWWERQVGDTWSAIAETVNDFRGAYSRMQANGNTGLDLQQFFVEQQAKSQAAKDAARRAEDADARKAIVDAEKAAIEQTTQLKEEAIRRSAELERQAITKAWGEHEESLLKDAFDTGKTALDRFRELQAGGYGDSIGAAKLVQEMRDALPKFSLPTAALRGSSEESAILSRAMQSIIGGKDRDSVESILKETEKLQQDMLKELEDIRKQLRPQSPAVF